MLFDRVIITPWNQESSVVNSKIRWVAKIQFCFNYLKDTLKAFDDFKDKQKNEWSNFYSYVKICIFRKCIQYTAHWDKTQMLKKFPLDKIDGTNASFFLSRVPSHHSFTFNLKFLHDLKRAKFVSLKQRVRFPIFDSVSSLSKFIFLFNKMHGIFDFKTS